MIRKSKSNLKSKKQESWFKIKIEKFVLFLSKAHLYMIPFFIVAVILIIIPITFIFIYSFSKKPNEFSNTYFTLTLSQFIDLFQKSGVWHTLLISLFYGLISSILSLFIGFPISYILSGINKKNTAKNLWIIITMPIWISIILKSIGLQCMFNMLMPSAIGTNFAIITGMIYLFLPFAIISIYNSLINQDPIYYQAALDLRASKSKAFWDIRVRYALPGITGGFNVVFIQSVTTLLIVKYLGGGRITLVSSLIETYFLKGNNFGYAAALSLILVLIVIITLGISRAISYYFAKEAKV